MKLTLVSVLLLFACAVASAQPSSAAPAASTVDPGWRKDLATYNIAWDAQSKSSSESMPLAGGILGLNVWTENSEICFLMASPNCMDENGMQVKLGLVRLHFSPEIFAKDFKQELRLERSEIVVSGKTATGAPVSVTLWCGVDHPVVHAEMDAAEPVSVTATYETWSTYQAAVVKDSLQWFRRLPEVNARRQRDMKAQGVLEFADKVPDPLSGLTVGGCMSAPGMVAGEAGTGTLNTLSTRTCSLKTASPVRQLDLCITLRMEQDKSAQAWTAQLARDADRAAGSAKADRAAALAWWDDFWNRSHICIDPGAGEADQAWRAGRNYQLFRYQLAANRDGRAMTLFNGGMFVCEANPDGRMWGGCQFMAQNQRAMAWPELKSGDDDLLKVSLDFYRDRTELRRLHAKKFWGVDGVTYPEPFSIFGLDSIGTDADGRSLPPHLHYHYTSGMEFALMMLEYGRFTGADISGYLAPAEGLIHYYDGFYQKTYMKKSGKPLDENGKLVIYPSDACEPFHGCTNNTDVICGLEALCQGLLDLPEKYLTAQQRAYYKSFQQRIPPISIVEVDGHQVVAPAKSYEWVFYNGNMDFPNMYVCFPFNHFFLGRDDNGIELAGNTWDFGAIRPGVQRQARCWYQSSINLARLGRTEDAKKYTLNKLTQNPSLRFPAFWTNYGFCHAPDTDHGGTAMSGLQEMIMQTDGRRILLGPAWPAEWNCNFTLHAPYQTAVEGHVADGKVILDRITPESRRKDVEIFPLKTLPLPPISQGKPATASSQWSNGYGPEKAFDGDDATRWAVANGNQLGWLAVDLGKPVAISRAVIMEISYPSTTKFAIEYQKDDGQWQAAVTGTTIGAKLELKFPPVTARHFRLNILGSSDRANIEEFQLFEDLAHAADVAGNGLPSSTTVLPVTGDQANSAPFVGKFVNGEGDRKTLEAIDAAFESIRPSARMVSLPLLYKRDWNGFVEAPSWPAWWIQNSFGATYGLMPFLGEEPYASWIRNSQDMWFRLMGDGKRGDFANNIGPDGCLCDCTGIELNGGSANGFGDFRRTGGGVEQVMDGSIHVAWTAYKQGDGNQKTGDFYIGATAAGLVMEADRLLARHDPDKIRLAQLKRVAAFLDSRRDPETNLLKGGHNCNLLAPSFRGVRKADGTYEFGYLTELSVNYVAGLERLAEVCLLCDEPDDAARYRDIAQKVRAALPRLMTPEGYFIRSEESDGRHGVFGAPEHGYFEAHPNHDAGAFRVTDDPANRRIVDFMLHRVKGPKPPGSLIPHGFVIPNYPGYDDHSGEGEMSYGYWTNGGVWPAHEGVMGIACFRAGEFAHPLEAWNAMEPLMEAFRADTPLADWGITPWGGQLAKPYCYCYDDWGPTGGILRGLFEYQYAAKGVRLWPHIPPGLTRYVQKMPSLFGQTRIFLASTGSGAVIGALVDGQNAKMDTDGSLFLPLDGSARNVTVEFLQGDAKSRGVPTIAPTTAIPPASDKSFWVIEPKLPYEPASSSNDWPLRIGASPAGGINFHGQIKNLRIYRGALDEAQVADRAKGEGNPPGLLADYLLDAAAKDGSFPGAASPENTAALRARLANEQTPKFENGGLVFTDVVALDIPSSAVVDFFEDYSLELQIRPSSLAGGRLVDRSTPGTSDGILLDLIAGKDAPRLRLITPWGVAQAKVALQVNQWQHIVATCGKDGLLCLYVDGKKVAETKGKMPVPQPQVKRGPFDFSPAGLFLTAMEKAGMGDSFEAGQARMVVELIEAYHQRRSLVASGTLHMPDLSVSNHIPPPNTEEVNKLYRNTARWILGGLQDHLNGLSLAKYPVRPEVLDMAKQSGLIPKSSTGDGSKKE